MNYPGTRQVTYTDPDGRKWARLIPEKAPDDAAKKGVPIGPPSLAALGLPLATEVALHNELFLRGLLTKKDARANMQGLLDSIRSAMKVDAARILTLYAD